MIKMGKVDYSSDLEYFRIIDSCAERMSLLTRFSRKSKNFCAKLPSASRFSDEKAFLEFIQITIN
jgi:hypothetical protein